MALLSERTAKIDTENAFKFGAHIAHVEASGKDVIKLNLGEPDFGIPDCVKQAVKDALDANQTHYCDPQGLASLREAIAQRVGADRGLDISPQRVVVFPGAKPGIGFAQQIYCNPGDEVIYPSPGFPIYESFVRYVGAEPVPLRLSEEHGFAFTSGDLAELISPRTKLIFLNFPSNPTGGVASKALLEGIAEVIMAKCSPDVRVYSDEIYERILFDGSEHYSIASVPGMEERTIISSGLSKSFAWTGGRLGYAVLPTVEEARVFKNLNINYFSCVPPYNQIGAQVALTHPEASAAVDRMVQCFQERRDVVLELLNAIPGVRCRKPSGAFYLWPNISGVIEHLDIPPEAGDPATVFQMFALYEHGVAVMDRHSFNHVGVKDEHYLRLSIASDIETLKTGVARIAQAARDKEGLARYLKAELVS